jgi:hypothetical protein
MAVLVLCCSSLAAQNIPLSNWTPPKRLSVGSNTAASVFLKVTPCRVVDTRNPVGPYGGPAYSAGQTRSFNIPGGPCSGIPTAAAYSLNFTIVNYDVSSAGFVTAYPTGSARPFVSTVNFGNGTNAVANAAIVPANSGGSIDVYSSGATNLIIDINGYFMDNHTMNTGDFLYLIGNTSSSLGLLFINQLNNTASTTAIYGFLQSNTQNGSAGVRGEASAASGITNGVFGTTASTTAGAAGVAGSVGTGANTSGVLGTGSVTWTGDPFFFAADVGVKGKASRGIIGWGTSFGVAGIFIKADGTAGGEATLGASDTLGLNVSGDGNVTGNFSIGGTLSKGAGTFKIDHPLDPENKILYHSFVESPDMMNIYNGVVQLDANGEATVQLPTYFEALNQDFRYQLTAMGRPQPNLYIADEVNYNMFRISGGRPNGKVSWTVTGIRHDVFANAHRVIPEVTKPEAERGYYLHPVERGEPLTKSIEAFNASDELMQIIKQREAERLRNESQSH